MTKIVNWTIARLKEKSTYQGITVVAGVIGYNIAPEFIEIISTVCLGVIGAIEMIRKESPVTKK